MGFQGGDVGRSGSGRDHHRHRVAGHDPLVAVPAFLTLVLIPFTYSIANGLGFGIIAWAVLHLATGRFARRDWFLYLLAALFLARFIYLGTS